MDQAPFWDENKPQAQRLVRCLWSCACQWCDILTECSHFGQGTISKVKRTLAALFHVLAPVDIEIERICLFRERVRWPAKPGFDQHDRLDLHVNYLCGRLSVREFCLSRRRWCGMGWYEWMACGAKPLLTLEEGPFLPDEYLDDGVR